MRHHKPAGWKEAFGQHATGDDHPQNSQQQEVTLLLPMGGRASAQSQQAKAPARKPTTLVRPVPHGATSA